MISLFFWPALVAALVLSLLGIVRQRWQLTALGVVLSLPFALYLAATPRFAVVGPLMTLCLAGAALAVAKGAKIVAWLLLLPFAGFYIWLALLINELI